MCYFRCFSRVIKFLSKLSGSSMKSGQISKSILLRIKPCCVYPIVSTRQGLEYRYVAFLDPKIAFDSPGHVDPWRYRSRKRISRKFISHFLGFYLNSRSWMRVCGGDLAQELVMVMVMVLVVVFIMIDFFFLFLLAFWLKGLSKWPYIHMKIVVWRFTRIENCLF